MKKDHKAKHDRIVRPQSTKSHPSSNHLKSKEQQLGGSITFLPPASSANLVDSYAIYLAQGAETKC